MKTKSRVLFSQTLLPAVISLFLHVAALFAYLSLSGSVVKTSKFFLQVHSVKELGARLPVIATAEIDSKRAAASESPRGQGVTSAQNPGDVGGKTSLPLLGTDLGIDVSYPRLSRILGEEGKVLIEVKRREDGTFLAPLLASSSGFSRLDRSAMESLILAINNGLLSDSVDRTQPIQINFIFRLTGKSF